MNRGNCPEGLHRRWRLLLNQLETRTLSEALERAQKIENFLVEPVHMKISYANSSGRLGQNCRLGRSIH